MRQSLGAATNPAIATAADGSSYIVWEEDVGSGNSEVMLARLTAQGSLDTGFGPVKVSGTAGASMTPDVAVDGNANAYVVWREGGAIHFSVIGPAANRVVADTTVDSSNCSNPTISTTPAGLSNIVYEKTVITVYRVMFAQLNASGTPTMAQPRVISSLDIIGILPKLPHVSTDYDGYIHIWWRDFYNWSYGLYYTLLNPNGDVGTYNRHKLMDGERIYKPQMAVSATRGYICFQYDEGSTTGIYTYYNGLNRIDDGTEDAANPSVATDAADHAYVAWQDSRNGPWTIYLAKLGQNRLREGPEVSITDGSHASMNPDLAVVNSRWRLVWQDNRSGTWQIFFTDQFIVDEPPDMDGDGVSDAADAFPLDPAASVDTDGDGMPDKWNAGATSEQVSASALTLDTDDDNDQMPDDWEIRYGLDPIDPADATQDGDGDGFTNLHEFRRGTDPTVPQSPTTIVDKVICGYQGWFRCEGDGSPLDRLSSGGGWRHWFDDGFPPRPGSQKFELYPDLREYGVDSLYQTGYAALGDGTPARLFSSFPYDVVQTHFRWMKEYGIDGAALQRFGTEVYRDPTWPVAWNADTADAVAANVRQAAEAQGRIYYVMYDVSGMTRVNGFPADFVAVIQEDWLNRVVGALGLPDSPQYARENGRPVVAIWGVGFAGERYPGSATDYAGLIAWFQTQGCYVVGGVPHDWRTGGADTKPGFGGVFDALDMISPWTVGRYANEATADSYQKDFLLGDRDYCAARGIAYSPVVFPGFAWSNWNGGLPNHIPRRQGQFLWRQAYNVRTAGIPAMYVAMFDEYDEATAIAKAAEDSSMVPTDQYFLTLSADGTYLSSDFYLRLVGQATRMIKGLDPPVADVPVPASMGPVYFRTSVEAGYDALPTWADTIDVSGGGLVNVVGSGGTGTPECGVVAGEQAHGRRAAIRYSGSDTSATASYAYFQFFDVDIPVTADTKLAYWIFPQQELGRYVGVDLVMTDGTTLRDSGAVDGSGVSMHPAQGRGTVNEWTRVTCEIGRWLDGKTIDRILIGYDRAPDIGAFLGYIDDILITADALQTGAPDVFPNDPAASVDTDGDGMPDLWDVGATPEQIAASPLVVDEDDDNDGMPDAWEVLYGLDPLGPGDAFLDPDGDGLINLQEYQGATNPRISQAAGLPGVMRLLFE